MTAAIFLLLSVAISNYHIKTVTYNYSSSDASSAKIVLLSDLHGKAYGDNNERLLKKIIAQEPDIICLAGDFIDEDNTEKDIEEFLDLLESLKKVAPVYYSYGNHDYAYFNANGFTVIDKIKNIDCTVLEENYVDVEVNGCKIRLGGMYDYAFNQQYHSSEDWHSDSTYQFLKDFTDTDRTKILMCHRPECFIYEEASQWNIDYVLCGHTHGGIWRLPIIGGLIAPEQGLFPEYDYGEFELENIKMIISSGLSGYKIIPRLFNSPEITVIELN